MNLELLVTDPVLGWSQSKTRFFLPPPLHVGRGAAAIKTPNCWKQEQNSHGGKLYYKKQHIHITLLKSYILLQDKRGYK
jgi:hypothetical protein